MTEHKTVTPSDFQRDSASELVSYMKRKEDAQLRDRTGQKMDSADVQRLIEKSERHEMSRHIVISPENADSLDRKQMSQMAKRTLRNTLGNREGVDYGYAIHTEDGDRPHAHVAATGRAQQPGDPLWLDSDDLQNMADVAHEQSQQLQRDHSVAKSLQKGSGKSVRMG